jgi:hypothetical protein
MQRKEQIISVSQPHESIVTGIHIQALRPYECEFQYCDCSCHKRTHHRSSVLFNRMMGSLFVGYTALPLLTPPCNKSYCHRRERSSIHINYYFPTWFLMRVFMFMAAYSTEGGPEMQIKMPRLRSSKDDIFLFAGTGNVDRIKMLFQRGLASPMDIEFETGLSVLHVSNKIFLRKRCPIYSPASIESYR